MVKWRTSKKFCARVLVVLALTTMLFDRSFLLGSYPSASSRSPRVLSHKLSGTPGTVLLGLSPFSSRRELVADVLVFRNTKPPSGGIKPTTITLEPGRGQYLGISFFESQLGSAGDQWRSSAWTAIASSSLILGEDFNQYRVSFDAEGNIDGPSAGGLFTTSTLALILGDSIRPDATMTGTISPDGSIGPVGGIPLKIKGARERGKRRVIIPAGQMTPELQKLEAELGIEIQEAANIAEAYQLLSERPLPVPRGFKDVRPQISVEGATALQTLVKNLHEQYQAEMIALRGRSIPEDFIAIEQKAKADYSRSQRALNRGEDARAYFTGREALARLKLVNHLIQARTALETFEDKPRDVSALTRMWEPTIEEAESLLRELESVEVKTANDAIATSRAFGQLILIKGLRDLAIEEIDALKSSEEPLDPDSEAYRRILFYSAIAPTLGADCLQAARDSLSLDEIGRERALQKEELAGFGNTLQTASVASIKAFESLTIQPLANTQAETFEQVAEDFKSQEIGYFLALASLNSANEPIAEMENPQNLSYVKLGAAKISYILSSSLIAKYYVLRASYDPDLEAFGIRSAVDFENERSLINMLDLAEVSARSNIAMAREAGNELTQQILLYEQAKLLREGSPADKIEALQLFWNASLEARLMTIFAGKFELASRLTLGEVLGRLLLGSLVIVGAILGWRYRSKLVSRCPKIPGKR